MPNRGRIRVEGKKTNRRGWWLRMFDIMRRVLAETTVLDRGDVERMERFLNSHR